MSEAMRERSAGGRRPLRRQLLLGATAASCGWIGQLATVLAGGLILIELGAGGRMAELAALMLFALVTASIWYAVGRVIGLVAADVGPPAQTVPLSLVVIGLIWCVILAAAPDAVTSLALGGAMLLALLLALHGMRDAARSHRCRETTHRIRRHGAVAAPR